MTTLRLPATKESLPSLCSFVIQKAEQMNADSETVFKIELVLEEVLTNVIKYAYPQGSGDVEIGYRVDDDHKLRLSVQDWGSPFNPLDREEPDVSIDLSNRSVGGLGIYMVRRMAQELRYERLNDRNVLKFSFSL